MLRARAPRLTDGPPPANVTNSGGDPNENRDHEPPGGADIVMNARSAERATGESASQLIDQRIHELEGWRGKTLARMRALILEADPEMIEEWKWSNPVW